MIFITKISQFLHSFQNIQSCVEGERRHHPLTQITTNVPHRSPSWHCY